MTDGGSLGLIFLAGPVEVHSQTYETCNAFSPLMAYLKNPVPCLFANLAFAPIMLTLKQN
jgi:hypothetical protein